MFVLILKIATTLAGCFGLWYFFGHIFDYQYHDIEFEEIVDPKNKYKKQLLISYIQKNIFGKFKTIKYFVSDEDRFVHSVYVYDTGEYFVYDKNHGQNREFVDSLEEKIKAKRNVKVFHETVEKHYTSIVKDLDKELNLKFENLEKEKAQAAKVKARIGDFSPGRMEQELIEAISRSKSSRAQL
jgi:asparagine synthetase A